MIKKRLINALFLLTFPMLIWANIPIIHPIGDPSFSDWRGVKAVKEKVAYLSEKQTILFRYPDGKAYHKGFRNINEGVANWAVYSGIRMEICLQDELPVSIDVCFAVPEKLADQLIPESNAKVRLSGKGWHTVMLPWNRFNIKEAQRIAALQSMKEIRVSVDGGKRVGIRNIQLVKGEKVSLACDIKGRSVQKGEVATYTVEVGNTTSLKQSVNLSFERRGWESMQTEVTPETFDLNPSETKTCLVKVTVTDRLPAGSREKQVLLATVNGIASDKDKIEFITASRLPHPNILHTAAQWFEIKKNIEKFDWAKKELDKYVKQAEEWRVPEIATKLTDDNPDKGMQLFQTQEEFGLMASGISYQLTGNKAYAEKIALFLRRLSDPVNGYARTFRGCHQSFVQEGHFFQHIVMAYDMIANSEVLTPEDEKNIEHTFRLFIVTVELAIREGGINNWKLSEEGGALYAALAIQDWDLVEKLFNGPCGIVDHLSHGVMNDGWWYECSVGYNVWCASEFSQIALALEPWGVNFKDMKVPSGTTPYYSLMPGFSHPGLYGMNFEKWGPVINNSVCIKDMWNAIPSFADYRGVMFAVNDAQETKVSGQPYELAYYLYRDPEYASIIRRGTERDLLYGISEMDNDSSVLDRKSAYADNMGIVMLRSQKEGRPQSEQIQAALHYGTHGGFHGHFDRTDLLSLMRYGRSFYNPEAIWYGYPSYMYKFYVQTSMPKNMVVVDQKMQEPVESFRKLFYTGKMMQATLVETNARWSNPPYGGMQYDYLNGISFAGKSFDEGRSIDVPKDAPAYGEVTGYTEPVLQRRLMVMTDDYVILSDYLKAEKEHTFDCLFQMKGFKNLQADRKTYLKHEAQMSTDPLGSAQFITDCNWWSAQGSSRSSFSMCWGNDCDNVGTRAPYSEDGELKMDIISAWPYKKNIMVGTAPEDHGVEKKVYYKIRGNGKILMEGKTGAWILGKVDIKTSIKGMQNLELETTVSSSKKLSLFWGNARVVLVDGKEIPLSKLSCKLQNVKQPELKGKDYYGGPIKIMGEEYVNALPSMPENGKEVCIISVDLSNVKAVTFKAVLGSDYPLGDETARRKTYSVRTKGKEARYLTVIEPYESKSVIKKVSASSADKLEVELTDGRIQEIIFKNMDGDSSKVQLSIVEIKNNKVLRKESTVDGL